MRRKLYAWLLSLSIALPVFLQVCLPVKAEELTPTVIYSTIAGGSLEIALDNAIYPVGASSKRMWYSNEGVIVPDGVNYIDSSEGQTAKLTIVSATLSNHMQNIAVTDTTTPKPYGTIIPNQFARAYVISRENYDAASLSVRPIDAVAGEKIYAKDITLYINSTPYPNFCPLKFADGGLKDFITVAPGSNTYTLTDSIAGRSTTVLINGASDSVTPSISSLVVDNGKADAYALKKTLVVSATDDIGLSKEAYYWEENANLSSIIKEKIMGGDKADDLTGITWTNKTKHEVTSNGIYTVFVKDRAGNIAYKDITVSKIASSTPYISGLILGKDGDTVYIEVKASDSLNAPLLYKLNDGSFQTGNRLTNVKEGINEVTVKNEAGVEVSATKEVFLSVYKDKDSDFSKESLYNYIQINPSTWTNSSVNVALVLPDSMQNKLASAPYSINGGAFGQSRSILVSNNNDKVTFTVKDLYGNTHTSDVYTVKNIDKELPSAEVTSENGTITLKASDSGSGIMKITVSSTNAANYVLKSNASSGVTSDVATYKAPANGSYQFTVYDFAGNTVRVSCTISCFAKDGSVQSLLKSSKAVNTSNKEVAKSGASTLGTKAYIESKNSGTHSGVSINRGYITYSNAGRSQMKTLPESETVEVIKNEESLSDAPALMINEMTFDNTNNNRVKKMLLILLPLVVIGSVLVVVIINSDKFFKIKK